MRYLFCLFLLPILGQAVAQDRLFQSGVTPSIAVSFPIQDKITITARAESTGTMFQSAPAIDPVWRYSYNQTIAQGFVSYALHPLWRLTGGYQYSSFEKGRSSHRIIQQVSHTRRKIGYRLGHRFRTAQTFPATGPVQYQFRYRLSAEFSLSGLTLEPGEFYVLANLEPIYTIRNGNDDLLAGLAGWIGRYFSSHNKLQLGVEYRLDRFLNGGLRQRLWMNLGYYLNL